MFCACDTLGRVCNNGAVFHFHTPALKRHHEQKASAHFPQPEHLRKTLIGPIPQDQATGTQQRYGVRLALYEPNSTLSATHHRHYICGYGTFVAADTRSGSSACISVSSFLLLVVVVRELGASRCSHTCVAILDDGGNYLSLPRARARCRHDASGTVRHDGDTLTAARVRALPSRRRAYRSGFGDYVCLRCALCARDVHLSTPSM